MCCLEYQNLDKIQKLSKLMLSEHFGIEFCGYKTVYLCDLIAGVIPHIHKSLIGKKGSQKPA